MPTLLRLSGLRVVIYPNDHAPAHVHVIGRDREAVFALHCPSGPTELRENHGFARNELSKIRTVLTAHLAKLCRSWRHLHDDYH